MKILITPDSFKGCLSALEVANHIEKGIIRVFPDAEILKVPMADGGEGTVQTMVEATGGKYIYKNVKGPLGEEINSSFGILGNGSTAIIEMAAASGLTLVSEADRNPCKTTTYGTGELIKFALDEGVEEIIIGIGGSATNDAGVGMAQALGICFRDKNGKEIGFGGENLSKIREINLSNIDSRIKQTRIKAACDVSNRLYGPDGAAHIYAAQKGATIEQINTLDHNLRYFSGFIKKYLGVELQNIPGGGAAGGLGAGIVVFLKGELKSGIELIMDSYNFQTQLHGVDLIITGEGKLDQQSINGKVPVGVAKVAKKHNIPVIALAGIYDYKAVEVLEYLDAIFSITQAPVSLKEAFSNTTDWLELTVEQIMRLIKINNIS